MRRRPGVGAINTYLKSVRGLSPLSDGIAPALSAGSSQTAKAISSFPPATRAAPPDGFSSGGVRFFKRAKYE
jgi:hypothetical protein